MSQTQLIKRISMVPENYKDKKFCFLCFKKFQKRVEMLLNKSENWHMCPDCGEVQPITTSTPLWWTNCTKVLDDNTVCNYPQLITTDQKGQYTKCSKCSTIYKTGA